MADSLSVTLHNRLSELGRLGKVVAAFVEEHHLPDKVLYAVNVALDEILTNIISYGYDDQADHEIVLRLSFDAAELTAEVEDDGRHFNPLEAPEPDLGKPLEERPIGGLGIHLTRKLMDHLEYRRLGGRNLLVMRKKVTA
jgi:anti-sigma regulatory factor (Ser/Thr protein kinase)